MIVSLLILCGFAFYVMTPDERTRALRPLRRALRQAGAATALGAAGGCRLGAALRARDSLALAGLTAAIAFAGAVGLNAIHLRTLTDVRPEIDRVFALETRTAATYETAVKQFRLGTLDAGSLAQVIERTIEPELQALRLRLASLDRVSRGDQPRVARAAGFLELRSTSWRLRAQALHDHSLSALLHADKSERAALLALDTLKTGEEAAGQ